MPFRTHLIKSKLFWGIMLLANISCSENSKKLGLEPNPNNTPAQQREADKGTSMAVRTINMADAVLESANARSVEGVATIENPAPR